MKQRILALAAFGLLAFGLSSCDKYEDGPSLSLRAKTERLANTWKYEYFLEDEKDVTARVDSTVFEILNNSAFTITDNSDSIPGIIKGYWYFLDETQLILYYTEPLMADDRDTMEILRLKEKELWILNVTDDGKVQETRLIPNAE
jgi:hypothetical protein